MIFWRYLRPLNTHAVAIIGAAVAMASVWLGGNESFRTAVCFFGKWPCLLVNILGAVGVGMAYYGRPHTIAADPKPSDNSSHFGPMSTK